MQAHSTGSKGMVETARTLVRAQGLPGLYRGGLPLFVGGSLFRSAQFGVNEVALGFLRDNLPQKMVFGFIDYQVIVSGFCGGIGRGVVEAPFEFIKVRRQVETPLVLREIFHGAGVTILRNSFLFSSFVFYIDISRQLGGLSPFMTGAVCASLAWLTIWPIDVIKSQTQSGNYKGKGFGTLLSDLHRSGALYRGLVPGLTRSGIANGTSMVIYRKVEAYLNKVNAY